MEQSKQKTTLEMIEGIAVFGSEFLHPTQLEIIGYALRDSPLNDLQGIFITNQSLDEALGKYCLATRTLAISVHELIIDSIEQSMIKEDGLSLTARCWLGFVQTLYHELHHNVATRFAEHDQDQDWREAEEEEAIIYAEEKMEEAIINLNAEIPKTGDFPLIDKIYGYMLAEITTNIESKWGKTHKQRLDDDIVFENTDGIWDSVVQFLLAFTPTPEKYERDNPGAAIAIVEEAVPNLFDQKILPGDQGKLFPDNSAFTKTTVESYAPIVETKSTSDPEDRGWDHYSEEAARADNDASDMEDSQIPIDIPDLEAAEDGDPFSGAYLPPAKGLVDWGCWGKFPPGVTPPGWDEAQKADATENKTPADIAYEAINIDVESGFDGLPGSSPEAMNHYLSNTEPKPGVDPSVTDVAQRQCPQPSNALGAVAAQVQTGLREILIGLYMRAYNHMFTTGVMVPLDLTYTEKESGIVTGCVIAKDGGGWMTTDAAQHGKINGCLYKNGAVQAYDFILNFGGVKRHMKMISQNPDLPSKYGEMARNGDKIVWILDADAKNPKETFKAKIINGVYSLC